MFLSLDFGFFWPVFSVYLVSVPSVCMHASKVSVKSGGNFSRSGAKIFKASGHRLPYAGRLVGRSRRSAGRLVGRSV